MEQFIGIEYSHHMNYKDFEIFVEQGQGLEYAVLVISSPADGVKQACVFPSPVSGFPFVSRIHRV